MVDELAATIGRPNSRPDIARWLTSMDRNLYTLGNDRILELVAVAFADGSSPGFHRIRHHQEPANPVIAEGAMTLEDAALALMEMRDNAPPGELGIHAVPFGIRYAGQITCRTGAEISRAACHNPDTCGNEINLGKGLAKYVPETGTEGECWSSTKPPACSGNVQAHPTGQKATGRRVVRIKCSRGMGTEG